MTMSDVESGFQINGQNKCEDSCKIFVGGLSWDTTQDKLKNYFSEFGEVVDCILMMDTTTRRSRGFGFVTYKDPSSVAKVLELRSHVLDNKSIDPKAAVPRFPVSPANSRNSGMNTLQQQQQLQTPRRCNKIFVGGIGQATEEDLRYYFTTYGTVTDVTIMMDKNTGRPRGFAFVGFENVESSEQTAQIRYHTIKGKRVEVKMAQPRDNKVIDSMTGSSQSPVYDENRLGNDQLLLETVNNTDGDIPQVDCNKCSANGGNSQLSNNTKNSIIQLLNDIWK